MTLAENSEDGDQAVPIRRLLRTSTAPLHERVDTYIGGLLKEQDGYARFLAATAGALFPLEHALSEAGVSTIVPDWPQRSRSAELRSDLAALSITSPSFRGVPRLCDEAEVFGVLYVLEGSRLGGRVVQQNLVKRDTAVDTRAMRFLSHGGGQPLWQSFLQQLEASRATQRNRDTAVAAAVAAFEMFLPRD